MTHLLFLAGLFLGTFVTGALFLGFIAATFFKGSIAVKSDISLALSALLAMIVTLMNI